MQSTAVSKDPNTRSSARSNAGMYVCTASNEVGQDKTAEVYVTVQCKSISFYISGESPMLKERRCSSSCMGL